MEDAFDGQVDVHQFGDGQLHQRQEDALDCFAHPGIFLRRLAYYGGRVDRVFPVGHAGDVKDWILVFQRVEAGVISEGAFSAEFVELDITFEDDFGVGWDFEIDGLALHQLDWLLAEESGDDEFFYVGRGGNDRGEG